MQAFATTGSLNHLDPSLLSHQAQPQDEQPQALPLQNAPSHGKKKSSGGHGGSRHVARKHMSCEGCRGRKMKCSRQAQCAGCVMRGEPCIWAGGAIPGAEGPPPNPMHANELNAAQAEITRLRKLVKLLLVRLDSKQPGIAGPPTGPAGYPLGPPPPGYVYHGYNQQYPLPAPSGPPQLSLQVPSHLPQVPAPGQWSNPPPPQHLHQQSPKSKKRGAPQHNATLDSAEALLSLANSPTTPSTASKSPAGELPPVPATDSTTTATSQDDSGVGLSIAAKAVEKTLSATSTPEPIATTRIPYPAQVYIDPLASSSGPISPMKKSPDCVPSHEARYDAAVAAMMAKRRAEGLALEGNSLPPLPLGTLNGQHAVSGGEEVNAETEEEKHGEDEMQE